MGQKHMKVAPEIPQLIIHHANFSLGWLLHHHTPNSRNTQNQNAAAAVNSPIVQNIAFASPTSSDSILRQPFSRARWMALRRIMIFPRFCRITVQNKNRQVPCGYLSATSGFLADPNKDEIRRDNLEAPNHSRCHQTCDKNIEANLSARL